MSKQCQISKVKKMVRNNESDSKRRTKRCQEANLQWKRFWIEEKKKFVRLRVTTKIIKTISKKGLMAVLKKHGLQSLAK